MRILLVAGTMSISADAIAALRAAGPKPIDPMAWFQAADVPNDIAGVGDDGRTRFAVVVDPHGSPLRCDIVRSSGSAELDEKTCSAIFTRAKFRPAKIDGKPVYGIYATITRWFPSRTINGPYDNVDYIFHQDSMLEDVAYGRTVSIVEVDGSVSSCEPQKEAVDIKLSRTACSQIKRQGVPVILNEQGRPVQGVVWSNVAFTKAPPTQLPRGETFIAGTR